MSCGVRLPSKKGIFKRAGHFSTSVSLKVRDGAIQPCLCNAGAKAQESERVKSLLRCVGGARVSAASDRRYPLSLSIRFQGTLSWNLGFQIPEYQNSKHIMFLNSTCHDSTNQRKSPPES